MSETDNRFGHSALNCRLTRCSGYEWAASATMLPTILPRMAPPQAVTTHEPSHGAASHLDVLAMQLGATPCRAVHLHVDLPNPFNFGAHGFMAFSPRTAQSWVTPFCVMAPVPDGHPATRDRSAGPVGLTMLDDVYDLKRRSSSDWAKKALASRRISFALRNSVTSRSSSHSPDFAIQPGQIAVHRKRPPWPG